VVVPEGHPTDCAWTFAEFFSGIGLVRLGLERADPRWRCVFANDLDATKRAMYAHHFGCDAAEIDSTDVHTLDADRVPQAALATASFPCTDLSVAGGRRGIRSGQSSAFWGFHRALRDMGARRPRVVLLENVVGFLTSHAGHDFRDAMRAMNDLGYAVDPFVLDAKWFTPQSRPRLFVVCSLRDAERAIDPGSLEPARLRPRAVVDAVRSLRREIRWSIRDLPEPPARAAKTLEDIIEDPGDADPAWWSEERVAYLLNQMFERHRSWVETRRHDARVHYATAFRRVRRIEDGTKRSMAELRADGLAGCLRTPKGGSARQILVRTGRGRVHARLLSAAECASLMGAKGYRLNVSESRALFGFGDAVCVDAIAWIARHVLAPALSEASRASGADRQPAPVSSRVAALTPRA
jgi:DNA (cytosine-5)-methyltransferase 1